jgi:transposase-like protein
MSVHPLSQEIIELEANNAICEAVGCSNSATINLAVKVGSDRNIQLFLCKHCVSKFKQSTTKRNRST